MVYEISVEDETIICGDDLKFLDDLACELRREFPHKRIELRPDIRSAA